jgi:hypothetical protein
LAKLGLDGEGAPAEPELIAHDPLLEPDLAWQVRAWGRWVLAEARKRLAHRYPSYAEFQALEPGGRPPEKRPLELLEPDENGNTDVTLLNARFPKAYLDDPRNPALGREADRRLSLGAHRSLQRLSCNDPAVEDTLAGKERP